MQIRNLIIILISFTFINNAVSQVTTDSIQAVSEDSTTVITTDTIIDTTVVEILAPVDTTGTFDILIRDSEILTTLDSLAYVNFYSRTYFVTDTTDTLVSAMAENEIPKYSDSVYNARIEALNLETPIELTYNREVKTYINLYAVKKRQLSAKMLGLAQIYFPMFEEQLDKYDMPLEIKYLAIVESALNPAAGSNKGAKGLWQFMYGTGKVYGLKVTSLVDDRYDPYKATVAACEHLTDLYGIYGDWSLALAAYNSGAGNVNRAIRRAGGTKNYWAVWPFLPRETRGYVPAFIAVNYVMSYPEEHNIKAIQPSMFHYDIDTVTVNDVLAFDQLNEMLGIPIDELKFLNPQFKRQIIPATDKKTYTIRIPRTYVDEFLNNEQQLYAYKTKAGIEREKLLAEIKKVKDRNIHIVRSGENLGSIAKKYHVYVNQIKRWNNLRGTTIYPGQKLVLYGSGSGKYYQKTSTPVMRSSSKSSHIVRSGENLAIIAKKYQCTVTDLKEWNNLKNSRIYPKQKLLVYKPAEKKPSSVKEGKYLYHVVRSGDTLWDIAKEYDGVTVDKIKSLNNIKNSKRLKPGQKLKVAVLS